MDEIRALFKITGPDLDRDEIVVGRQGLRVGRGADNNLVLNHREISRAHMRILWREDDKFLVEDLNSSNGVWFNEARIPSRVPIVCAGNNALSQSVRHNPKPDHRHHYTPDYANRPKHPIPLL